MRLDPIGPAASVQSACFANDLSLRGKCRQMSEAAAAADPSLTLVRGYYHCPFWGRQAHWWTIRPDGTIFDPTAAQFPSLGYGEYERFDGTVCCDQCGAETTEERALIEGRYAFCDTSCFARFVGIS